MTPNSRRFDALIACASLAVLALGTAGCLCPPCPGTAGAAPATAATGMTAMGAANPPMGAASATPVAEGGRLVVWDGDGAGPGAQGWESCDKAPNCVAKVGPDSGSGTNGSTGLKLHGRGAGVHRHGLEPVRMVPGDRGRRPHALHPSDVPDPRRGQVSRRRAGPWLRGGVARVQQEQEGQRHGTRSSGTRRDSRTASGTRSRSRSRPSSRGPAPSSICSRSGSSGSPPGARRRATSTSTSTTSPPKSSDRGRSRQSHRGGARLGGRGPSRAGPVRG